MIPTYITYIPSLITTVILGVLILKKNRRKLDNILFSSFTFALSFWIICLLIADNSNSINVVTIFSKLALVGPLLSLPILLIFSYIFPHGKWDSSLGYKKIILFLVPITLALFATPTKLNVASVTIKEWGADVKPGILYYLLFLYALIYLGATFRKLYNSYRKVGGVHKLQIKYLFFGIFITGLLMISTNIVPVLFNYSEVGVLGPPSVLIFIAFTTYAIVKYRLMDIRLVISRSLLYLILVAFVTAIFTFLTFFTATVFNDVLGANAILTTLLVAFLLVVTLDPLKKYIAKNTDKIFFKGRIDYQNVLRVISELISLEIDLENLTHSVIKILTRELKLDKAILFLPNKTGGGFTAVADSAQLGTRITKNHPLLPYLKKYRDLIVVEELEREVNDLPEGFEKRRSELILDELQELGVSLCVPVFVEGEMRSILMLGKKLSGEIYNKDDLDLLEVFSPQLGTAIEKAKLYKEVKDFNIKLKQEVKKATKNLSVANLQLQQRNRFLATLNKVTTLITRTLDFKKVTQNIVDGISKEMGYLGGILLLIDREEDRIYIETYTKTPLAQKAAKLLPQPVKQYDYSFSQGDTLSIRAAKTGEITVSPSFSDFVSPPAPRTAANLIQKLMGIKTTIAVPIFSENKVIGVILFAINRKESEISDVDYKIMRSLANQTGIVFKNLELYEEVQKTNQKLKVANVHLKELDKAKSEFMSIASHQLRTPLSGIMGYLSMMQEGDFGAIPPDQMKVVQELLEASRRLIRMVNLFLNVTRIEAGRFKLNKTKVDVVKLIRSELKELKPTTQKKHLKLEFQKPQQGIPTLNLDEDKIKDVILNLVDNATKYTEKGGITVSVGKTKNSVIVSVKDTGVGIRPEETDKLFSKFVRGSGISRLSPDGSGLGLFIARKIVDAHSGKIWAESKGEGKGSTFKFELPLK